MAFSRFADVVENALLDRLLGDTHDAAIMPDPVYVALITTAPTDANGTGIVEVAAGGYARVAVANTGAAAGTNWPSATGRQKTNGSVITFPQATADWGTIVGVALYDAVSAGNFLGYGDLTNPTLVSSGAIPDFPPGSIVLTSPGT